MNKHLLTTGLLFLFAAGCVNPYRNNFNSTQDRYPTWLESRMAPKAKKPRLVLSEDISSENWKMFERGYIMIGFSKFDGPDEDVNLAIKQAKAAGADIVLVQKKFSKTLTETVTFTEFPPDETTTIRENADVVGEKGVRRIERRTEVRTSRGPETVYVPKQVNYFEHSATFWRKMERPVFGAFVQELSDEQKQKLETNHGLVIRAIMADSPAHQADVLKGDIILKVDGVQVPSVRKFYEDLESKAGKQVELLILRGEKASTRKVTLNS
jgi:C-terminal processing protease CtpA/Prc